MSNSEMPIIVIGELSLQALVRLPEDYGCWTRGTMPQLVSFIREQKLEDVIEKKALLLKEGFPEAQILLLLSIDPETGERGIGICVSCGNDSKSSLAVADEIWDFDSDQCDDHPLVWVDAYFPPK